MINFKLNQSNFNYLETQYKIIKLDNINFKYYYQLVVDSINYFNSEIQWDEMFDFNTAYNRILNGMTMYIGMIDSDVFGYVWFDNYKDGRYLFNLFVRNLVQEKNYTGKKFVSDIIHRFEYEKPIYAEVDEWNEKSIKLFKKLGFISI